MAIQRWDPVKDLVALQRRMNDLFEEALTRSTGGADVERFAARAWSPPVDLVEGPEAYVLRADLPGVEPGDVDLTVADGTLTLRGARPEEPGVPREAYLRVERPRGPFEVQVALPPSVDPSGIRARHSGGVVEITLPRRPARSAAPISIAVEEKD